MEAIYSDEGFEEIIGLGELPEDTSIVFFVLKKKATRAVYFNCDGEVDDKIRLDNMHESYNIRPELLKSRQFYNNASDTSVNYEDLMALKKELMR